MTKFGKALAFGLGVLLLWSPAVWSHFEADGLVVEHNGELIVHVWQATVIGSLSVPYLSQTDSLDVTFLSPDSVRFLPDTTGAWLKSLIQSPGTITFDSLGQWSFALSGLVDGTNSGIRLRLWFYDHFDYTSPVIPYVVEIPTAVKPIPVPDTAVRLESFPDPIQSAGTVRYAVAQPGHVNLTLYDVAGRAVRTVENTERGPGWHAAPFEVRDLPSGVYFLRITAPGGTAVRKIHVLK